MTLYLHNIFPMQYQIQQNILQQTGRQIINPIRNVPDVPLPRVDRYTSMPVRHNPELFNPVFDKRRW